MLLGVSIAIVMELRASPRCRSRSVYLPLSASTPIFVGGLVRWAVDRGRRSAEEAESSRAYRSSGPTAGGAIGGIGLALLSLPMFEGLAKVMHVGGVERRTRWCRSWRSRASCSRRPQGVVQN